VSRPTRPWFKLYARQINGHPALRGPGSRTHKAVLLELMCLAHEQDPYGVVPPGTLAGYLAGDAEAASSVAFLRSAGIVNGTDNLTFRTLLREYQRSEAGASARARRGDLAGTLAGTLAVQSQSQKSEELTATQSDGGSAADASTHRPKSKRGRRDTEAEAAYKRAWTKNRPGELCVLSSSEGQAMAEVWSKSGRDAAEIERRACQMFTNPDPWIRDNPVPRTLLTNWVKLGGSRPIPVDPEGFEAMNRPNPFAGKV
jgi:hypothetical protein